MRHPRADRAPGEHALEPTAAVVRDEGLPALRDGEPLGRRVAGDELRGLSGLRRHGEGDGDAREDGGDPERQAAEDSPRGGGAVPANPFARRERHRPRCRALPAPPRRTPLAAHGGRLSARPDLARNVRSGPLPTRPWTSSSVAGADARGGPRPATVARRSAVRTYFRHLVLIGMRDENPAASLKLPAARGGCRARCPRRRPSG